MNAYPLPMKAALIAGFGVCLALLGACGDGAKSPAETPSPDVATFSLTSEAFGNDETIPALYACDGENVSPPLAWSGAPAETKAYALIMDDPDAPGGTFTHWVLFDLPAEMRALATGVKTSGRPPVGGAQGGNDADGSGYTGPCPPPGDPHHYRFTLYALDGLINLDPGAKRQEVLDAAEGHVVGRAELVGSYGR
jgi:Raf kinase inhibitor-like YbhB/YbcL family protein